METKKLTCYDLMVGDYVMAKKEPIRIATPFGNETVLHQLTLYGYTSDGAKAGPFLETELTPIPLTAEILMKNGIRNYSELPEYKVRTNEYEIWVIFDEPQNCVHVEKFDKGIPTIYHSKILFVHELQHALRLCGINDKEIVL